MRRPQLSYIGSKALSEAIPPPLTYRGSFKKLSNHLKKWNARLFVLDPIAQQITYFEAEGRRCRGDMRFVDITIAEPLPAIQFPDVSNPFRVATGAVEWTLSGEDESQVTEFLDTLRTWVGKFKKKKRKGKKKQRRAR